MVLLFSQMTICSFSRYLPLPTVPEQVPRYPYRLGWLSTHLSLLSLRLRHGAAQPREVSNRIYDDIQKSPTVTGYRGHRQSLLLVRDIIGKAHTLVILNHIVWPDHTSNPGLTSNLLTGKTETQRNRTIPHSTMKNMTCVTETGDVQ